MMEISEKILKRGRLMYILEATFEYLISILVAGSFLATLTEELGFSDSLTGILSSVISLGCMFQLFSMLIRKSAFKRFVIIMSILNQLLFMLLYVIPLSSGGKTFKTVIFVIAIIAAYLIYNIAHPKKINWLMSLVDDHHRGVFTANKEIVSLLCGMVFSFLMGALVDYFAEKGEIKTAFILSAIVMLVITVLHTVTMLLTPEKTLENVKRKNVFKAFSKVLRNKKVLMVTAVFILYNVATYSTTPFYGAYKVDSLGFTMTFNSILTVGYSIIRSVVSRPMGRFADRRSFASMMTLCFVILSASLFVNIFTVPSNGRIMFTMYYILYAVAMAGINSGVINLLYDYVPHEKRTASFAFQNTVSGLAGFGTTWLVSRIVEYIQQSGNMLFGINIYAQQAVSAIGFLFSIAGIMYLVLVVKRIPRS